LQFGNIARRLCISALGAVLIKCDSVKNTFLKYCDTQQFGFLTSLLSVPVLMHALAAHFFPGGSRLRSLGVTWFSLKFLCFTNILERWFLTFFPPRLP